MELRRCCRRRDVCGESWAASGYGSWRPGSRRSIQKRPLPENEEPRKIPRWRSHPPSTEIGTPSSTGILTCPRTLFGFLDVNRSVRSSSCPSGSVVAERQCSVEPCPDRQHLPRHNLHRQYNKFSAPVCRCLRQDDQKLRLRRARDAGRSAAEAAPNEKRICLWRAWCVLPGLGWSVRLLVLIIAGPATPHRQSCSRSDWRSER
jgi:hypothetical protein